MSHQQASAAEAPPQNAGTRAHARSTLSGTSGAHQLSRSQPAEFVQGSPDP
jgi:hypothetical protein